MRRYSLIVISLGLCFISSRTTADDGQQQLARDEQKIDSASGKKGWITSPGYPRTSEKRQDKTFTFSGKPQELVQIIFHEFNVPKLAQGEACGRNNAYLSYSRQDDTTVYICGHGLPLPILSETPNLLLEYTVPENLDQSKRFRGFNATYQFITNFGINTGVQSGPNECSFEYKMSNAETGVVSSPNFPGFYPSGLECTYSFQGGEGNLTLTFTEFNLFGAENSCTEDSDELEITETSKKYKDYFHEQRCGQYEKGFKVSVSPSSVTLVLRSLERERDLDASQKFIGFNATYKFSLAPASTPAPPSGNTPKPDDGGSGLGSTLFVVLGLLCLVLVISFCFICIYNAWKRSSHSRR